MFDEKLFSNSILSSINDILSEADDSGKSSIKAQLKKKKALLIVHKKHQKDYQKIYDDAFYDFKVVDKRFQLGQKSIAKVQEMLEREQAKQAEVEQQKEEFRAHMEESDEAIQDIEGKMSALVHEIEQLQSMITPVEGKPTDEEKESDEDEEEVEEKKDEDEVEDEEEEEEKDDEDDEVKEEKDEDDEVKEEKDEDEDEEEIKEASSNATIVHSGDKDILVSYETPVAFYDTKEKKLYKTNKKWSNTTSKHIGSFISQYKDQYKDMEDLDQTHFDKLAKISRLKETDQSDIEKDDDDIDEQTKKNIVNEVSPPDKEVEDFIKKNKDNFKKEYGPDKGMKVLYSLAWKKYNDKK